MAYDPAVLQAVGTRQIQLKAAVTGVKPGSLLGYSGGWVLADADAQIEAVLMSQEYQNGDASYVNACIAGILEDNDAPYTAGALEYLSATAGAITETIPAISTTLTITQQIGQALDTSRVAFDLRRTGWLVLRFQQAIDVANLTAVAALDTTVSQTGILAGDLVDVILPATMTAGIAAQGCHTITTDSFKLRLTNASAGSIDPASLTYTFYVRRA